MEEDMSACDGNWSEDICRVCGAHVGWGIRELQLGYCDDHAPHGKDGEDSDTADTEKTR